MPVWRQVPLGVNLFFLCVWVNLCLLSAYDWRLNQYKSKAEDTLTKRRGGVGPLPCLPVEKLTPPATPPPPKIQPIPHPPPPPKNLPPTPRQKKLTPFHPPPENRPLPPTSRKSTPSLNPTRKCDKSGLIAGAHNPLNRSGLFQAHQTVRLNKFDYAHPEQTRSNWKIPRNPLIVRKTNQKPVPIPSRTLL